MFYGLIAFVIAAVFGFWFGSRQYLKRVAAVMLQLKIPPEEVDKMVYLVSQYNKLKREAKKKTKATFTQSMVDEQLEKMKKEDRFNG